MKDLLQCRINVMVSDMARAISFYVDTLGLQLLNRYGDHYAEIQAPGLLIGLHPSTANTTVGNNLSIGFGVRRFDQTIEELGDQGIHFEIEQDGWIRLAYFTDPDGNQLYLAENK